MQLPEGVKRKRNGKWAVPVLFIDDDVNSACHLCLGKFGGSDVCQDLDPCYSPAVVFIEPHDREALQKITAYNVSTALLGERPR